MLETFLSNYALPTIFLIPGVLGLLGVIIRPEAWRTRAGRWGTLVISLAFVLMGLSFVIRPLFPFGE